MPDIDYETYSNVCKDAIHNENIFNTFKQNYNFTYMLEHVGNDDFINYLINCFSQHLVEKHKDIIQQLPWDKYRMNDTVGGPLLIDVKNFKNNIELSNYNFSHTTLRYISTSLDIAYFLQRKFGKVPDRLSVVSIGDGYGGLTKILVDTLIHFNPDIVYDFTIIDLEWPSKLQRKYLDALNVPNITCVSNTEYDKTKSYDLFVSTYSIGEIPLECQTEYIENVVSKCESGFMVWNVSKIPDHEKFKDAVVIHETPAVTYGNKIVTF